MHKNSRSHHKVSSFRKLIERPGETYWTGKEIELYQQSRALQDAGEVSEFCFPNFDPRFSSTMSLGTARAKRSEANSVIQGVTIKVEVKRTAVIGQVKSFLLHSYLLQERVPENPQVFVGGL